MRCFKNKGFTLIELLVVIAVIGVLATVVLLAVNPAEQLSRARDVGRKSSLRQIANALERYKTINGSYPITGGNWCGKIGWSTPTCAAAGTWIPGLVASGELKLLPEDPTTGITNSDCDGGSVTFLYFSDGPGYKLLAHCGMESASARNKCLADINSDAFCNPGRPTWAYQISSDETYKNWY